MSYPPPPGPQGPPPQNQPSQNPGWQQQPYQPQGGNWAAPPYGGPPHKNRAGLIIVLIVVLVVAILSIGGFLAYRLTSGVDNGGTAPAAPPSTTRKVTPPAPPKTVPSVAPTKLVPSKPIPTKPATSRPLPASKADALALASAFVSKLNADNAEAAVDLTCADTKTAMPTLIRYWIEAPTKLTVGEPVIGQDPYVVPLTGTTKGHKVSGMVIIQGSCVRVFQLS